MAKVAQMTVRDAGMNTLQEFFKRNQAQIAEALPKHVTPERMLRIAMNAVRTTPELMKCEIRSIFSSVGIAAQLGLEPNTPLQHCFLVPYRNTKENRVDCQFIPGYRGFIELAARAGISLQSHLVYENDDFDFCLGLYPRLEHKPHRGNRGELIGAYAVAIEPNIQTPKFEFMFVEDINKIRDGVLNKLSDWMRAKHTWTLHYEGMCRKTPIRHLAKYLQLSPEMATAVRQDEIADEPLETTFSVVQPAQSDDQPDDNAPLTYDASATGSAKVQLHTKIEKPEPAEWPREVTVKDNEVIKVDAANRVWDGQYFSGSFEAPSMNADNTFRKKRGHDLAGALTLDQYLERVKGNNPVTKESPQQSEDPAPPVLDYASWGADVLKAKSQETLDELLSVAADTFTGQDLVEVHKLIEIRRRELGEQTGGPGF